MSAMTDAQLSLFGPANAAAAAGRDTPAPTSPDEAARAFAVDPANNVLLEASAGTGKTSVLVARYVNLVTQGVEPANILAITFTRKAAAEMRERIVAELRAAAARSTLDRSRWIDLRDRLGEIAISTIDAFCLSLLREFPLEADLEPGFDLADETEVPRIVQESLERSLRIIVAVAREDADVALVLAQLGLPRTRQGLAALLDRRLVARAALDRFLARGPADLTAAAVCRQSAASLHEVLQSVRGGLAAFLADGPVGHGRFGLFAREVARLGAVDGLTDAEIRGLLDRIAAHFLTGDGQARKPGRLHPYLAGHYPTRDAEMRHRNAVCLLAPDVQRVIEVFRRDLNVVLARGVRRMFSIAVDEYRTGLEERAVLDFSDVLERALGLLRNMGEFSGSRYRLEYRYHHVLVDEFQDTSRAQWELISLLVRAWGEGLGLASQPSIFIVGDRKQSIYRFRDAEVAVLREAAAFVDGLRPGSRARRSISRSFRAVPTLQAFVNDVFTEIATTSTGADGFTFEERDRFPVDPHLPGDEDPALGLAVGDSPEACAAIVADEIRRILEEEAVRDRETGLRRQAVPGDIAILFRSRTSHREFERELIARGIPAYVYKGLGFFDADEIKDLTALLRFLANPASDLRAAALLRSRFFRLSDAGLAALAPRIAASLGGTADRIEAALDAADRRVLARARAWVPRWVARMDRIPPSELLEQVLIESAYAFEIRGPRRLQAWENIKKMRGLVRRVQNRGYATMARLAEHLDSLGAGDESNAVLEALDAVNLMTVHAAKGLEFPVVFVVNLARGATGLPQPVRVIVAGEQEAVSVGPFTSEVEKAERERDRHETRRVLYVAMTRARDRLYLSATLKEGRLEPGPGSLAEVLPPTLQAFFPAAAEGPASGTELVWTGVSGREFSWRVCRPAASGHSQEPRPPAESGVGPVRDALGSAPARASVERMPVTAWLSAGESPATYTASGTGPLLGNLVHRLFASGARDLDGGELTGHVLGLLRPEERALVPDPADAAAAAIAAWRAMLARPELASVLATGQTLSEVPFSLLDDTVDPPRVLRGAIDLLVRHEDGSIVVVELKTGGPQPTHRRQLDLYVHAARAIFSSDRVEGLLLYL
jgi:ATP-dependent helicase/nuclease subunit A